jgi:hypothetical protein
MYVSFKKFSSGVLPHTQYHTVIPYHLLDYIIYTFTHIGKRLYFSSFRANTNTSKNEKKIFANLNLNPGTLKNTFSMEIFAIFLRLLFFAWGLHFWDLSSQALCCGGQHGISPVHVVLKACALAHPRSKWQRFLAIKTIFWFNDSDWFIQLVPRLGILCSIVGGIGYYSSWMFRLNFCLYHSVDVIFFDSFCFPWENLMFSLGFLSIFAPSLTPWDMEQIQLGPWSSHVVWAYRWLLFRLMFGFGKTKFLDDSVTTDNSLYIYNFLFAQPMPNKFAKWATDYLPKSPWLWKGAALHMWFVEIPLPFCMLFSYTRLFSFYGTLSLQFGIFFTGCFGQFNMLTCILCLSLLIDDGENSSIANVAIESLDWSLVSTWCIYLVWTMYIFVSIICVLFFNSGNTQMWSYWADLTRATETNPKLCGLFRPLKGLIDFIRVWNDFRILHGYGVFPRNKLVPKRLRHRIDLSWNNGKTYDPCQWKYLGVYHWCVAPFQPKMDFIMWYHGNGMNLEGFTVSFASPRPSMFSECGMPSRIAHRIQERRNVVMNAFEKLPRHGSYPKPNKVRLQVEDHLGNDFFTETWEPEPWTRWMPSIEEYHWDTYLIRLRSTLFQNSVNIVEKWMLNETNAIDEIVISREIMEYDGEHVSYKTIQITGRDIVSFVSQQKSQEESQQPSLSKIATGSTPSSSSEIRVVSILPSRKNCFILTYLTWIIVHRVLKPWPKNRSWYELSLLAHAVLLSGWRTCLLSIRTQQLPKDIVMYEKDLFLPQAFVNEYHLLWKTFYPLQWKQTERTIQKLYAFDRWNTGVKFPVKGAGVLAYPHLFLDDFKNKAD